MTKLPFFQVDAFADRPFAGNPAAVMPLDTWLPDALLQRIAAENNLSETAFLVPSAEAGIDRELRWFTPTTEIGLCGHATLASGHVLLAADPRRDAVRFRTRRSGVLEVRRAGGGYALSLPALAPEPRPLDDVIASLGLERAVDTAWHANGYAIVLLDDEAAVRAVAPDFRRLADGSDTLAIVTAPGTATDIVSRAFAPNHGIDEDPVTGGAHAALVPYWAKRLGRDTFTAYQASARGGRLDCRLESDRAVLGGECVTVIEGAFTI
jgi:PhzF family phenazine biosynthesis protein